MSADSRRTELSTKSILNALVGGILASGTHLVLDGSFYHALEDHVEHDTLAAKSPETIMAELPVRPGSAVLDFGCGNSAHRPFLEGLGYTWRGLNHSAAMASEAAAMAAEAADPHVHFYDGFDIPFKDNTFAAIWSFQTFEHIQDITVTFRELSRVLKPGGRLVGAVSYLEQIHDFSTFNFTPYGFKTALERAGLQLRKIYPRADAFTFLLRRLLVVTSASDENSLTASLHPDNEIGRMLADYAVGHADIKAANLLRLMFSTHFAFDVIKA